MGDTRIVYGLAYGKQGNWYSLWQNKTHGVLAQASTAPDVTSGVLFYSANSAATTISDLKLSTAGSPDTGGNIAPLFEGKIIKIFFTDANTTVSSNAQIYLANSAAMNFPANSWLGLVYHNSAWYETERSVDYNSVRTVTIAGTNNAITVTNADAVITITGTGATQVVSGISGGYVGQRILLIQGSGGATITMNTGSNIKCGSGLYTMSNSGASIVGVEVLKVGVNWIIPGTVDQNV